MLGMMPQFHKDQEHQNFFFDDHLGRDMKVRRRKNPSEGAGPGGNTFLVFRPGGRRMGPARGNRGGHGEQNSRG